MKIQTLTYTRGRMTIVYSEKHDTLGIWYKTKNLVMVTKGIYYVYNQKLWVEVSNVYDIKKK